MFSYFKGNLAQMTASYYTYQIQTDKEVVYIGFGHLSEIYSFQQVMGYPGFDKNENYTVIIHNVYPTRFEAVNAMNALINKVCKGRMPKLNMETYSNKGCPVKCNETGAVYPNAYKACEMLHIPPPRMCNHLKGRKGHKTIHGLTYSYVKRDELP